MSVQMTLSPAEQTLPSSLYVLGGRQRKPTLNVTEEWNQYEAALILEVDTRTGSAQVRSEYKTPPAARATDRSSALFKSGALVGDKMYTCTSTEVLVYDLPRFTVANYVSLPCFNDLHHVVPDSVGNLLVTSTGLDLVVNLDRSGTVLQEWNVLGENPWGKFSRDVDYRKVESTQPHRSHPNFVFELDDKIWVTRFEQRDAICLNEPRKRIDIAIEAPHDGHVRGNYIYFTTVDGHLVIAGRDSLRVERTVDLAAMNGRELLLGWCRGLLCVDPDKFWVGFTRIRRTKLQENLMWLNHTFRNRLLKKPTHIALYDISAATCLREINLEDHGMNVVFDILPAARAAAESRNDLPRAADVRNSQFAERSFAFAQCSHRGSPRWVNYIDRRGKKNWPQFF
jgi:hypothetical protein